MEADAWADERMQDSKDGNFYAAGIFCRTQAMKRPPS